MRIEDVREKLLSFYEGSTSQEEERELYVYFSTTVDLPEELENDKQIFMSLFDINDSIELPVSLEDDLNRMIDGLVDKDASASRSPQRTITRVLWIGGVAACLALVVVFGIKQIYSPNGDSGVAQLEMEKDTFSDPEQAYKVTEEALLYTSAKMNKVLRHLEKSNNEKNKD